MLVLSLLNSSSLVNVKMPRQKTRYHVTALPIMSMQLKLQWGHLWTGPPIILLGCFRHVSDVSIVKNHSELSGIRGDVIPLIRIMFFMIFTLDLHKTVV